MSLNKRTAALVRARERAQSGKDKRVCSHATARAYCRFHKHRRLFVVDKRISMSMGARRQRGGVGGRGGGRRHDGHKDSGAIDGERAKRATPSIRAKRRSCLSRCVAS